MAERKSTRAVAISAALIAFAMSLPYPAFAQECTPADITLSSQSEVDDFQANHGHCGRVTGELRIEGPDIVSLAGLSDLQQVQKLYITNNTVLTSLQGLSKLDSAGSVYIAYNESLVSLAGLEGLVELGYLTVRGNSALRTLHGLSGLTRVGANLFEISGNAALENLDGLESLHTVVGEFIIEDNHALENIDGLSALSTVTIDPSFTIRIQRNAALANLDGLSSLSEIPGGLVIHLNDALEDVDGLAKLASVGTWLHIAANPALTHLDGLQGLVSTGSLAIVNNTGLANINGLSSLETVSGIFEISWNAALPNLDGLSSLVDVGSSGSLLRGLLIENNASLANLDGLSTVQAVGNLVVRDNRSLAGCQGIVRLIDPIDDHEPGPGPGVSNIPDIFGEARIQRNPGACHSVNGILGEAPLFGINAGISDAWFDPDTDGQGFLIVVFPQIRQIFLAWFTYDTERPPDDVNALLGEPGHRWLTAQGPYEENVALLEISVTSGGVFDNPFPETVTVPDGEMTLEFSTCNSGMLSYDIESVNRQGLAPIERIALDNVPLCYLLNAGE
jgi:hypothetical protein